ncbi:hypothetical protein GCM10023231_29210 [Olivibacter ginsenosidimutans]|uniref:Signal transduction histidine kinase internal region domain-containing protein n=1 Tax=Olivibacter ginsenosidimutans TaxID=1176537 RepID=A0ABP9BU11_9SPHI
MIVCTGSCQDILAQNQQDHLYFQQCIDSAEYLIQSGKFAGVEELLLNATQLAEEKLNNESKLRCYTDLAGFYYSMLRYHDALKMARVQLKFALLISNDEKIADAYNNISLPYHAMGDLKQASVYLLKAIHQIEGHPAAKNRYKYFTNLASIFIDLGDQKNSLYYAKKAFDLATSKKDNYLIAKSLINLSISEVLNKQPAQAKIHLQEVIHLAQELKNTNLAIHAQLNLGDLYNQEGQYQQALKYYQTSAEALKQLPNTDYDMYVLSGLASTYDHLGNHTLAKLYFEKMIPLAKQYMTKNDLMESYQLGVKVYEKVGDYQQALAMQREHSRLQDSILNASTQKVVRELEAKYQLSNKEKTLAQQQLQLKEKNRLILLVLIAMVLLFLLMCVVYLVYRNKHQGIQLALLKAQIHPHFLFNTLNNLYALSMSKSSEAPDVITSLSDILRYILYECNVPMICLEREIGVIEQYLRLERIRFETNLDINFYKKGNHKQTYIAPLLLLPLVENAFKHGVSKQLDEAWIHLSSEVYEQHYIFKIANSKPENKGKQTSSPYGHIGLANIYKRLDILYPKRYKIQVSDEDGQFIVLLKLFLK